MPIHLAPRPAQRRETRRNFLGRAAAGASALLLGGLRPAPGQEDARKPVWALLSDTHIHESLNEANQGSNMASNLRKVVSEVIGDRPTAALVNGDLAREIGKPGDYQSFLTLAAPLREGGVPVHLTLGNHDDRASFLGVLGERGERLTRIERAAIAEKYCESIEQDGVRWLLLDSLEEVNKVPGILGAAQLDWVARELDSAPATPAVIFVHHNVEPVDVGLKDTKALLEVLRPRRQLKCIFFGHTHEWRRFAVDGIHMVNLPAIGYAFKKGEPMGWVRGMPRAAGLTIELRSLDGAHPDHGKKIELEWRANGEGGERVGRF